jgi:hypothetical protein
MTSESKKSKTKNSKQTWTSHKLDWINDAVSDPDRLTDFQSRVAVALSIYFNAETGECYVKQTTLAKRVGGTRRGTQKALDRLVELHYIKPPKINEGPGGTNIYAMIKRSERLEGCESTSSTIEHAGSHPANPGSPPPANPGSPPCESPFAHEHLCFNSSASTPVQDICSPPISGEDSIAGNPIEATEILPPDNGFSEFWAVYPNKVAKAGARRKYNAILEEKKATAAEIIAGAEYYARRQAVVDPEGQYTKHPEVWLNKGCWPDRQPIPDRSQAARPARMSAAEQVQVGLMNNLRRRGLA